MVLEFAQQLHHCESIVGKKDSLCFGASRVKEYQMALYFSYQAVHQEAMCTSGPTLYPFKPLILDQKNINSLMDPILPCLSW